MNRTPRSSALGALFVGCVLGGVGCETDDGGAARGILEVRAYGEEFIEQGIGAAAFEDGWAVQFSRFEVEVASVTVAGQTLSGPVGVDLTQASGGAGQPVTQFEVAAASYSDAAFALRIVGIEGLATKGADVKSISWALDAPTRYSACETSTVVSEQTAGRFEITVHADHLFYDSLVSQAPALRFQPLADADTDGDGAITRAELEAASIGGYDPGNADVATLWEWLVAQAGTVGHVDGEGHCESEPLGL